MILIIGATGKTSTSAIQHLLDAKQSVRALVRNPDKAKPLQDAGVDVVIGDVADDDALAKAMDKVEKVFLLLPNGEAQLTLEKRVTDFAVTHGVSLLVKQSSMETVPGTTKPIPQTHLASEAYIRASGLKWVMIRPTFFTQMLLTCARSIKANDSIVFPMGQGKVAPTDARDVGAVAAKVLIEEGHEGKSYDLTGPELLDFNQIAEIFSDALQRPITYVDQPLADYRKTLEAFIDDGWRVNAVCEELKALADGSTTHTTNTPADLLGRKPLSVQEFVKQYAAAFKNN